MASELAALKALTGVRCVDAGAVESSVAENFDTEVELQRRRLEVTRAKQEVTRLAGLNRRSNGSEAAAVKESDAAQERLLQLEAEVAQLQRTATAQRGKAFSDLPTVQAAGAISRRPARWSNLKSGSCLDLDDSDDDDSGVELQRPQARIPEPCTPTPASSSRAPPPSVSAAKAQETPPSTSTAKSQAPPPSVSTSNTQAHPPAARAARSTHSKKASRKPSGKDKCIMTPKEYLSRLRSMPSCTPKRPAQPVAVQRAPAGNNGNAQAKSSASLESPEKAARAGVVEATEKAIVAPAPSQEKRATGSPSAVGERTKPELPVASSSQPTQERNVDKNGNDTEIGAETAAKKTYQIDVGRLVPKPAQGMNRFKESHPAEFQALMSQGEVASPEQNLYQRQYFGKRKHPADGATPQRKASRADDSNEQSFQRRQMLYERGASASSEALCPKQQVDESGELLEDESGGDGSKLEVDQDANLSVDLEIEDGLRCPRWLWEALYPYQHTCVKWLWQLHRDKLGGIVADEMGLGKTIQIIAYLAVLHYNGILQKMRVQNTSLGTATLPKTGGVLIVVPATLLSQWRSELHLWYPPLRVCTMHQMGDEERRNSIHVASTCNGVLLTSYETMARAIEDLLEASWVIVILDEGQRIRNPNTAASIAAKRFSTPHRIVLSGSPIQNRLQELWSLFDFICPGRLGTLPVFLEEFAEPIEKGNLMGATEARVAAAYACACALRELTLPCIMRRTKAEVLDVIKLPHKQEQVLFCNLTPEQYQVYVDFLQTEQVGRAMRASQTSDRKAMGAVFFAISVVRKLCNHPDLLLLDSDPESQPEDLWNHERSGKMKVLAEIMKLWYKEGHRALIFVQTVQMLEVVKRWMEVMNYPYLKIDGRTAVSRRGHMIEEFNRNEEIFAMVLTTRVGGVGLNIIGADRVVIFDPDWNPMTDVQARERAWRIGQKRDVIVYRLVLTGTLEEKVYQRQVYKHFLSQKVLTDPRQRQFFKWSDLAELFDVPPMPPDFDEQDAQELRAKYKELFQKMQPEHEEGELATETTEVMRAISDLPTSSENTESKETADEHNAIMQTLYDSKGIRATFNHDKVEQPHLDRKLVREGASLIAKRAIDALKRSAQSYQGYEPGRVKEKQEKQEQWSGPSSKVVAGVLVKSESKVKRELPDATRLAAGSGVSSKDILDGLRQLAAIRSSTEQHKGGSQSAKRVGASAPTGRGLASVVAKDDAHGNRSGSEVAIAVEELHKSDRRIAELILHAFLNPRVAGREHRLTTDQVLHHIGKEVAPHHQDLFKSVLKQMCELSRDPGFSGVWTLRPEFWPSTGIKFEPVKSEPL